MLAVKQIRRNKIKQRVRRKISGTAQKPRLSVFRSNKQIYAQVIDDTHGVTLAQASSRDKSLSNKKMKKSEFSKMVGKEIAKRAIAAGIKEVVFDRNGYLYHGRVKALAEGAREGGLKF